MLHKISIQEDGELKNLIDCREQTIRDWLYYKKDHPEYCNYLVELIILLLKELKNEKDNKKKETNY